MGLTATPTPHTPDRRPQTQLSINIFVPMPIGPRRWPAHAAQAGWPHAHFKVINFFASSHWAEQYLPPGCAKQLQPSFAHFWGVVVVIKLILQQTAATLGCIPTVQGCAATGASVANVHLASTWFRSSWDRPHAL